MILAFLLFALTLIAINSVLAASGSHAMSEYDPAMARMQDLKSMLERESRGSMKESVLETIAMLGSALPAERPRIFTCATLIDHLDSQDPCIQATASTLLLGEPEARCRHHHDRCWSIFARNQTISNARCKRNIGPC